MRRGCGRFLSHPSAYDGENMCDILRQSAEAYRKLSLYAYTIIGGRKGKQITVEIRFPADAYHHLAGFQECET
jgi:hypothetical protein